MIRLCSVLSIAVIIICIYILMNYPRSSEPHLFTNSPELFTKMKKHRSSSVSVIRAHLRKFNNCQALVPSPVSSRPNPNPKLKEVPKPKVQLGLGVGVDRGSSSSEITRLPINFKSGSRKVPMSVWEVSGMSRDHVGSFLEFLL